jgi:hypothetical protein
VTLADEDDPAVVHTGALTCSLNFGPDHTAAVWGSATGPGAAGVATLPPTLVDTEPVSIFTMDIYLCARLDYDGGTLYWNEPYDRNSDGWWTTNPLARCDSIWETADLRAQDEPQGTALSAAFQALGEADAGTPLVSFARVAGQGAVVRAVPSGWTCTDVHTGTAVTRGSALTTPDPGVTCAAPASYTAGCSWMDLSAYLVPVTLGRVTVTESCGGVDLTRVLTAAQARVAEQWSGGYGGAHPPLRCTADEDTTGVTEPAYVVTCGTWG